MRQARPPYGVQGVPFRVRPGPPRDAPHGVQGVQCGAPGPPSIRCARCAMRRDAPAPHTVCKLCHSGRGPDLHRMRPTVCKVCNSTRRARLPYGVQCVPFRVRPGPPRNAADGVQGVQFDAPGTPPIRCASCAIPGAARTSAGCAPRCASCASRRAEHAPLRCASCAIPGAARTFTRRDRRCARCASRRAVPRLATGDWPPATDLSVQAVPFRVRPGPSRDAPDGVQGVQFARPASRSPFPPPGGFHGRRGLRQNSAGFSPPSSRMLWAVM